MSTSPTPLRLNSANLEALDVRVARPTYDRKALRPAIVHIGVGGFHRAHQAVYLDTLLHMDETARWGICGFGVLSADSRMRDVLRSQDFLYTVMQRSAHGTEARVIGSIIDFVLAPDDRNAAVERLASPETKIVSLTVTEGGYFLDDTTGQLDTANAQVLHDAKNSGEPVTWMGYVLEALRRRKERGQGGFTLMSCDNLQGNGNVTRRVLSAFAALQDRDLAEWVGENVAFPNSMVDRITPATTPADVEALRDQFGIVDAWPVVTEPFLQWVIEDHFQQGRPEWDRVGAEMVDDVLPYELMKMRLLNGSHLAMAYLGALSGYQLVHEIMADPLFTRFIQAFMEEVTPVVPRIPGTSLPEYKRTLIERFANPTINDQVRRICSEGSAKMPKWVVPSIQELLEQQLPTTLLSFVIASWIRYFQLGCDPVNPPYPIVDARAAELCRRAAEAGADPGVFLHTGNLFGQALPASPVFQQEVQAALNLLREAGPAAAMERILLTAGAANA